MTTNQTVYTRNGSFSVNNDRFVVDSAGQFVLALPVSDDGSVQGGEIADAQPLKLELEAGEAKKTDNLELAVNLPASSTVFDSAADSASFNVNTISITTPNTNALYNRAFIEVSTSSMTAGQAGQLEFRATGFMNFSAEL